MVGYEIRYLREKYGISLQTLSERSSIDKQTLKFIETKNIRHLGTQALIRIADSLQLKYSKDFVSLLKLNSSYKPSFKAFRIGIICAGSSTLANMFSRYHTLFEFYTDAVMETITFYRKNKITKEQLISCIKERDVLLSSPELESSFEPLFLTDVLAETFPTAKFIFTIRDCYSWLNYTINWLIWYNQYNVFFMLNPGEKLQLYNEKKGANNFPVLWKDYFAFGQTQAGKL
ncbi:helix-turn-helix domain-containing protein [Acidobacteriota bacterium]